MRNAKKGRCDPITIIDLTCQYCDCDAIKNGGKATQAVIHIHSSLLLLCWCVKALGMANPPKPWKVEYAKSSRSTCKTCKNTIAQDKLRIAKMVAATQFDGFMPIWNHAECVLKKRGRFQTVDDVEGVDALRWEDQQKIRKYVEGCGEGAIPDSDAGDAGNEFAIENAKSSRATCKSCNQKIQKGEVRISTMSDSDNPRFRGKVPAWRHAKCFLEMGLWTSAMEKMPGWDSLTDEDKQAVQYIAKPYIQDSENKPGEAEEMTAQSSKSPQHLKHMNEAIGQVIGKKRKPKESERLPAKNQESRSFTNKKARKIDHNLGDVSAAETAELEKKLEKQTKELWTIKDGLQKHVKAWELREMLEVNDQDSSGSEYDLRERCADGMLFGALGKCPLCGGGLEYAAGRYRCRGFLTAWSKCAFSTTEPERLKGKWKIPEGTDNEYLCQWFKSQKGKKPIRVLPPKSSNKSSENPDAMEHSQAVQSAPLQGLTVTIVGNLKESLAEWKDKVEAAGGKLLSKITRDTDCVVANESEIDDHVSEIEKAASMRIPIVRESFLCDCLEKQRKLPMERYRIESATRRETIKVKVKGRSSVHEDSGLQETGHILEEGKSIYNTTLNMSDLSTGINSYYILQVIEDDKKAGCYVFRKWGRVGNDKIGGQKLEKMSKSDAIREFKRLFKEKTGNEWEQWEKKDNFEKQPGKFFPLEIDYGVDESRQNDLGPWGARSKLDTRVVDLMKMLFDLETYRAAMMEFEINMAEMPLGKLSKSNIQKGFEVLTEIQNLISLNEPYASLRESLIIDASLRESLIIDASNRFFTLIPTVHPHVIRDGDDLKSKIQMLETLRDIEIASSLISFENEEEDPLDANYKKLRCNISPLPHDSSDYQLVKRYLERTHAPTHKDWSLELEDVFAVDREGEYDAYIPFKNKLKNRMLLWHGSRVTNFVGILSQGLRIAPPEAPVTGYMFGKGLYFADLVSKSAQYCYTQKKNPVGLMLLSEVALGEMHELKSAKYMEKPPKGKHSIKGVGKTKPLETEYDHWADEVVVPCGRPVPSGVKSSDLLYNEYIVYDQAQVKLQFLLKVRFHYKR